MCQRRSQQTLPAGTYRAIAVMPIKVFIAAIIEIAYCVFTRTWLQAHAQGVELELMITGLRVVTAAAYWLIFRDLILSRGRTRGRVKLPWVLAGAAVALTIPFLFRGWDPGGGFGTAVVFALTSIVVGLREELLYRAVLLNLLEPTIGTAGALLLSTAIFVVYHYGSLPVLALPMIEVTCMSLVLGLIYVKSGSLIAVVALHSLYDGIWFFGPYLDAPLPNIWRLPFLISALALVFWGTSRFGAPPAPRKAISK